MKSGKKGGKRTPKKSDLATQADKFFSFHDALPLEFAPLYPPSYYPSPMIIRTFTTYSVCETPIPDLRNQKPA